ncbi:MAG TPA: glycosyltransferase [Nitrospira sp.]|nr:glycosyltransferase [Nitrospira sp.]
MSTNHLLCSVVIPTYRRPHLLLRCLSALCTQTLDKDRYEIVVVDDGVDRATERVVESCARVRTAPSIRYLTSHAFGSGPAVARNIGWNAARGRIVAFTDDDCRPRPDWLAAAMPVFDDEQVSGAWGSIVVPLSDEPTDYERNTAGLERAPFATANCFYRQSALSVVGGFDERFTTAWREDSDLQFSFIEQGYKLVPAPDAVVEHPVRPAPWGVSVRQQRNNLFNALLFKKHPALYRQFIQPSPPWHYYVNVVALLGATAGLALEWSSLLAAALTIWVLEVGRFCGHRLRHTSRRAAHVAEMAVTSILIPPVAVYWRLKGAVKYRVAFF